MAESPYESPTPSSIKEDGALLLGEPSYLYRNLILLATLLFIAAFWYGLDLILEWYKSDAERFANRYSDDAYYHTYTVDPVPVTAFLALFFGISNLEIFFARRRFRRERDRG